MLFPLAPRCLGPTLRASFWHCALAAVGFLGWHNVAEAQAEERAPYITQRTALTIPFSVSTGQGDFQPVEVQVFISFDRGKNWQLYSRHRPEEGEFLFRTKRDGEYWLATRTIDSQKRMYPDSNLAPQLKLIVDTAPPTLELTAEAQATGELALQWRMRDEWLDLGTFELAYQSASTLGDSQWVPMPLEYAGKPRDDMFVGQTTWMPQTTQRVINIRAQVKDKAGNPTVIQRQVFLPRLNAKPELAGGNSAANPNPSIPNRTDPAAGLAGTGINGSARPQELYPPVPASNGGNLAQANVANEITPPPDRFAGNNGGNNAIGSSPGDVRWPVAGNQTAESAPVANALRSEGPGRLASSEGLTERLNDQPGYPLDSGSLPFNANPNPPEREPPAETQPATPVPATSSFGPGGNENWLDKERPRLTRSRRFSLDYEVDSVTPENLGDVELWGTSDGGRSWMKWGSDNDRTSPFEVEVGSEAIYGFRIVIVARNGVSSRPPQAGDAADIWIQVDASPPVVRLTQAAYGDGEHAGQLDLRWEAADANLTDRPITLSFADRPDGPWTTIAAGVPNTGQFWWPFDPRSPRQIYLRIEAKDAAGNVGMYSLPEPISVEGLIPRGRIRALNTPDAEGRDAFLKKNIR